MVAYKRYSMKKIIKYHLAHLTHFGDNKKGSDKFFIVAAFQLSLQSYLKTNISFQYYFTDNLYS